MYTVARRCFRSLIADCGEVMSAMSCHVVPEPVAPVQKPDLLLRGSWVEVPAGCADVRAKCPECWCNDPTARRELTWYWYAL